MLWNSCSLSLLLRKRVEALSSSEGWKTTHYEEEKEKKKFRFPPPQRQQSGGGGQWRLQLKLVTVASHALCCYTNEPPSTLNWSSTHTCVYVCSMLKWLDWLLLIIRVLCISYSSANSGKDKFIYLYSLCAMASVEWFRRPILLLFAPRLRERFFYRQTQTKS